MALSILSYKQSYDNESIDDLISLEPFGEEYENSLRPSLADKLQVGFLASDQCTQTYDTEILEIKKMTETVKMLVEEMSKTKRDLQFTKQVLKAAFEDKLQSKAFELYDKLNERMKDLQAIHEERVEVCRRSFKQQLQDVLVRMTSHYKKYYEAKLAGKLVATDSSATKHKIASLEAMITQNESVIHMMEIQMENLQNELAAKPTTTEIKIDTSELDALQDQNNTLQAEIYKLNDRVDEMAETVELRDEKIKDLVLKLMERENDIKKERDTVKRLAHQIEDMAQKRDSEKMNALQELDRQKLALERDMASKLADSQQASANQAKEKEKLMEQMEMELERRLLEERKNFEMKLSKIKEENRLRQQEADNSKGLERVVEQYKAEIQVLKQRLIRAQKQWEKKFMILRASLHAIKDESYIRLQLQKQAATLKYASISYGPDVPSQPVSQQQNPVPNPPTSNLKYPSPHKQLPAIPPKIGKKTTTLPSGAGTEPFSGDEEEEEEIVEEDFLPLPPKPNVGDYMPSIS